MIFERGDASLIIVHTWHTYIYVNMTPSDMKSIRDSCQCIRLNKIDDSFGQITKEQTMCIYYRLLQHVRKIDPNLTYC